LLLFADAIDRPQIQQLWTRNSAYSKFEDQIRTPLIRPSTTCLIH